MSNEQNNEISSVQLTPYRAIVKGELNLGSYIVNDYIINIVEEDNGYSLEIRKGSQVQVATLNNAISIDSIFLVDSSQESGGKNTIRVVLSNGEFEDFDFYNGVKGDKGDPGLTYRERQDILEAEVQRINAENQRIIAENERSSNEELRGLNEAIRTNAESERVAKEKNRVIAENNRESAESARVGAENVRQYNESQRQDAEYARNIEWQGLKNEFNASKQRIDSTVERVEELAEDVAVASNDVVEAYDNVNRHIERSEDLLEQVEEASYGLINLSVQTETLEPTESATAEYNNGVLRLGIPQGIQGDDYVLTSQDKSDIGEQALDKLGMYVDTSGYIRQEVDGESIDTYDIGERLATDATLQSIVDAIEALPGSAQDAADAANAAAILATAKANLANTAATLANEKAGLANSAADFANAKANLANTAAETANQAVEDLGDAATAKSAAEQAQSAAENAASSALDYKEAVEEIADGIAQEDTAESIQSLLVQINSWLEQIAENGMGSGDLNGFSLSLNGNNQVILSYINPEDETDTADAILATGTTGNAIVQDLQEINASMRLLIPETEGETNG